MTWRKELLDRWPNRSLGELFVILWTAYEPQLEEVEKGLRSAGIQPLRIEPVPAHSLAPKSLEMWRKKLAGLISEHPKFDETALCLVKGMDLKLRNFPGTSRTSTLYRGLRDETCTIHPRNNFIAEAHDMGVTWVADQGRTMFAYARYNRVSPVTGLPTQPNELAMEIRHGWASRRLEARLQEERRALKIMMWAFDVSIEYPEYAKIEVSGHWPPFIHLSDPANDQDVLRDALGAIDAAREARVTILIFPELAVSAANYGEIQAKLAQSGGEGYPLLTVVGLCHQTLPSGELDVNEAVLLGPDGTELHRHRKMHAFTLRRTLCGERLDTGRQISILSSPIGNLAILICLDLFHRESLARLSDSDANLLLVPSLSQKTTAHEVAATQLLAANLCSTYVCNRGLAKMVQPSCFFRVPSPPGKQSAPRMLIFELFPTEQLTGPVN